MSATTRHRFRLPGGTELSYLAAGDEFKPAVLLLHGLPNAGRMFEAVMADLAPVAYLIAPDLPGFGNLRPAADSHIRRLRRC